MIWFVIWTWLMLGVYGLFKWLRWRELRRGKKLWFYVGPKPTWREND